MFVKYGKGNRRKKKKKQSKRKTHKNKYSKAYVSKRAKTHHANICIGRKKIQRPRFKPVPANLSKAAQYRHENWKKYVKVILYRDGYQCRRCISDIKAGRIQARRSPTLQVHHRKYYGPFIWSVAPKDLITLCYTCHKWWHGKRF